MSFLIRNALENVPVAEHYVFTRFGIGVFDVEWLEYRVNLFKSVTYPSVVAQQKGRFCWVVFVDNDIDLSILGKVESIAKSDDCFFIVKLDFYVDYFDVSEALVKRAIEVSGGCLISKIDDDDCWHQNTFSELYSSLRSNCDVYVFPTGYDFLCQERVIVKVKRPFITHSSHFFLKSTDLLPLLRYGHHRVPEFIGAKNLTVKELAADQAMWLYSRHKQSDSRFSAVKNSIMNSNKKTHLTEKVYKEFSFDMESYNFYRQYASKAKPADKGKTWDINQELQAEATALKKKLREVKKKIIESTANVL
jgi:hypothetical protein